MPEDLGYEPCGRVRCVGHKPHGPPIGLPGPPPPFSVLVGTPPTPSSPSISTPVVEIPPGRPWDLTSQADTQRVMMQLRSGVSTLWGAPWPAENERQGEPLDKFPLSSLLGELLQGFSLQTP